jgi:exodeoxyribonuclease VII large subunit
LIDRGSERLNLLLEQFDTLAEGRIGEACSELEHCGELMRSLSPEAVLSRGFSMTMDLEGRLVTEAEKVSSGDRLKTRFADGDVTSVVE